LKHKTFSPDYVGIWNIKQQVKHFNKEIWRQKLQKVGESGQGVLGR